MATEKWTAPSAYANAFTPATLDALASGNAVLSDLQIDNSTNLDMFMDVSIALGSAAFVAPNYVGIYLYPLNADNTTYGDSSFATAAAGPPPSNYFLGSIGIDAATKAQTGTLSGAVIPPGKFKLVFYNQGGVALVGSGGNSCQYRTYDRSVA